MRFTPQQLADMRSRAIAEAQSSQGCELCGNEIRNPRAGQLKGICASCDRHLNGGRYSAKIVKAEAGKPGVK